MAQISIRLTDSDEAAIERAASEAQTTVSDYVRQAALDRSSGYVVTIPAAARGEVDMTARRIELLTTDEPVPHEERRRQVERWIEACAPFEARTGVRADAALERYREVVRRARPALAPNEWRAILDACNGLWLGPGDDFAVQGIPFEVGDAMRLNDLATKWLAEPSEEEAMGRARIRELARLPPDAEDAAVLRAVRERGQALVQRLVALDYAALLAIAHVVDVWWKREPANVAGPVPGEEGWVE